MTTRAPEHCRPAAYELFAKQMEHVDSSDGLLRAAVAIALHEQEHADPDSVDAQVEALAAEVFSRLNRREPHAILAHTHAVLFDEMGFGGDTQDFYNPINSYLPSVLERRRGIPITLTLIYKCVLERLGLSVRGINAPAHFLAAVKIDGAAMYVDPFHGGRSMSEHEAMDRVEAMVGHKVANRETLLLVASHTQWLARMLQNLVHIFGAADRQTDAAAMIELAELLRKASRP